MKYISDGTWFDKGTEAILLIDMNDCGLFRGLKDGYDDEEMCSFSEFLIINKEGETDEF